MSENYDNLKQEFLSKFKDDVAPKLEEFQEQYNKKEKLKKILFGIVLTFILIGAATCIIFNFFGETNEFIKNVYTNFLLECDWFLVIVFPFALIMIFILSRIYFIDKKFEHTIKPKIMKSLLNCFDDIVWTQDKETVTPLSEIEKSCALFFEQKEKSTLFLDDAFIGKYNDFLFEILEFISDDMESNLVLKIKSNKKFKSHTVIKPKISPVRKKFDEYVKLTHLNKIKLEDVNFEKNFEVFSDDEVEVRYLLTPAFMERMIGISSIFEACITGCSFYNGDFYLVMIPSCYDLFSIGQFGNKLTNEGQFEMMFDQIISIYKLIDYFKLTEKTGI